MVRRTAVVYHFFPHYRAAVLTELARCHPTVLVGSRTDPWGSMKEWEVPPDIPFIETSVWSVGRQAFWQTGLQRLALGRDCDSIIYLTKPYCFATWLSALLGRLRGKRVFYWTHGWKQRDKGIVRLIRDFYHHIPHGLLLYGHRAKMVGLEEGFSPDRLHVIYNSLDYENQRAIRERITPDRLRQTRMELFGAAESPVVICVCRLIPGRRLDLLIDAVARLAGEKWRVNLVLVGDGPDREHLERRARESSVNARFLGECYSEDRLAELFMAATVTVAPSQLGLTGIHSLSYGTPVITNDVWEDQGPEYEAIIPGRTGDLCKRSDVGSLAEAIRRWTAKPLSQDIRQECIRMVERLYNPRTQVEAILRAVEGSPADDLFWQREASRISPRDAATLRGDQKEKHLCS